MQRHAGWQAGTGKHPFASWGQPCGLMGTRNNEKGTIPRRKGSGHRVSWTPEDGEKLSWLRGADQAIRPH